MSSIAVPKQVLVGPAALPGDLVLPEAAPALIVFAHGSGSSRQSPRNRAVAQHLQRRGLGTLAFDLLTVPEAQDRTNVFDIDLLCSRVEAALAWLEQRRMLANVPVGLFGASTGAAAALVAAAHCPHRVFAVVSRGGRPDLAAGALRMVRAPTLLIVGGADDAVLELNRRALRTMSCETRLDIIPGATHLFEEAGALEQVAQLAADWFLQHLPAHTVLLNPHDTQAERRRTPVRAPQPNLKGSP